MAMDAAPIVALAEPTRLRIVSLLGERPRSVGEIAEKLGIRQPQATKHLQVLARAGLVTVHPLGQRRVYALEREPLRRLRRWLEGLESSHPSEDALEQYRRAVEAEEASAERDPAWAAGRRLRVTRTLAAPAAAVWGHWTQAALVRRWWSPEHFAVARCDVDPEPGGRLSLEMEEAGGARYAATGRFLALAPPRSLSFEMAPLGPDGEPLFSATHELRLTESTGGTDLSLDIRVTDSTPAAAPAIAGMRIGWEQSLTKLARELNTNPGS